MYAIRSYYGVGHRVGGDQPRPDRTEPRRRLALAPLALVLELVVALGNVVEGDVTGDVIHRVRLVDVVRGGADHHSELGLPVEAFGPPGSYNFV